MLGKKRGIKAPQLKHKSTKSKLSDLNQRSKKVTSKMITFLHMKVPSSKHIKVQLLH